MDRSVFPTLKLVPLVCMNMLRASDMSRSHNEVIWLEAIKDDLLRVLTILFPGVSTVEWNLCLFSSMCPKKQSLPKSKTVKTLSKHMVCITAPSNNAEHHQFPLIYLNLIFTIRPNSKSQVLMTKLFNLAVKYGYLPANNVVHQLPRKTVTRYWVSSIEMQKNSLYSVFNELLQLINLTCSA